MPTNDPSAKVRLQLALTLGQWKEPAAGEALARLAIRDCHDAFIAAAVLSSALPHAAILSATMAKADSTTGI